MSLPNYLSKIKSSGIYRFVFDKSLVPQQEAETLRLLVGYSEKGPFNTPVYIESSDDFIKIFGNINKRLERKGVYFHRLCLQALSAGPILALNLKPFNKTEKVNYSTFDVADIFSETPLNPSEVNVDELYDTDRFWSLDFDKLPNKVKNTNKFITIAATDNKDLSCTVFFRKSDNVQYDLTIREWYANNTDEEMPEYLEKIADDYLKDYFMDVYVFRGNFTMDICKAGGPFGWSDGNEWNGYFTTNNGTPVLNYEYKNIFGETEDPLEALASNASSNYIAKYQGCTIPYFKDGNGNYIALDVMFNNDQTSHKMIMKLNEDILFDKDSDALRKYMKSVDVSANMNYVGQVEKPSTSLADAKKDGSVKKADASEIKVQEVVPTTYKKIYLEGFNYQSLANLKDAAYIKAIMDVTKDPGVREGLTNKVSVDYHYLVDTFKSFGGANCKVQLSTIAKYKDNAFAILNYPARVDEGDTTTLPTDEFGASWAGYFTPVIFSDGAIKYTVPSAALVSNNFMDKWGARQPYYIVAGPTYGKLNYPNLVGPDFNYSRKDLDVLEPKGVNAIVYVPRKGTYINSNQTAKQNPVTALSKIHVRELVIYLQDSIESMLQNYQWELNTQTLRDNIKSKADTILENVMNNGGVYAFTNVCDETNNTAEVIDNEMIILDTAIEPARGAGKMVQRLTIHKTGGITSSSI